MNRRLSLHIGINDYPGSGSDLSGCINDALDTSSFAASHGYTPTLMLDGDATRANVLYTLRNLVATLGFGDRLALFYSGHGSWVRDTSGDEADARDECLVLHDYANGGVLMDDDLHEIFKNRRFGVRVMVFSDSCHSGTVLKFAPNLHPIDATPKYFPAPLLPQNQGWDYIPNDPTQPAPPRHTRAASPRTDSVLVSGCADLEYSYDANFFGRFNGAFTRALIDSHTPNMTFARWHAAIRKELPNDQYDQSPQLNATRWQRTWKF